MPVPSPRNRTRRPMGRKSSSMNCLPPSPQTRCPRSPFSTRARLASLTRSRPAGLQPAMIELTGWWQSQLQAESTLPAHPCEAVIAHVAPAPSRHFLYFDRFACIELCYAFPWWRWGRPGGAAHRGVDRLEDLRRVPARVPAHGVNRPQSGSLGYSSIDLQESV